MAEYMEAILDVLDSICHVQSYDDMDIYYYKNKPIGYFSDGVLYLYDVKPASEQPGIGFSL